MRIRHWNIAPLDTETAAMLAEQCELNPFLALLLTTRKIREPEEVYDFLAGQQEEIDPYAYADMEAAAERLRRALDGHERILVFGDYDVDGLTATALLYDYLRGKGADVLYRIPRRSDGYGMHAPDIAFAAEQGVRLIVTVDHGIAAVEEAEGKNPLNPNKIPSTTTSKPQMTTKNALNPFKTSKNSSLNPLISLITPKPKKTTTKLSLALTNPTSIMSIPNSNVSKKKLNLNIPNTSKYLLTALSA